MKILPIKTEYTYNKPSYYSKPVFGSGQGDTFVKTTDNISPLKTITSKTAEMLYSLDYTPISEPREGYYLAHVLDRKTLKPVDIYIQKQYSNSVSAEYFFYRKIYDDLLKLVGIRHLKFNDDIQKVTPSDRYMVSYDKNLMGIGLLEHQIAVEEMLKRGYKNVQIDAIQGAYDFHTKAGFKSTDYYVYRPPHRLTASVYEWCDRLKAGERTVRDMLVFQHDSEVSMLNLNKTLENLVLYVNKNGIRIADDIKIRMELPELALKEWKELIKLKPILK